MRLIFLISVFVFVTAPGARAHFNDWDSVDGSEIRYEMSTQWSSATSWAIDRWNYLGQINIAPDTASTIADLQIVDYSDSGDGRCGYAGPRAGADKMALNQYFYLGYNTDQRRACALHELGHTLRLEHSYVSQAMDPCPVCSNPYYYISPQGHDQLDYHELWG